MSREFKLPELGEGTHEAEILEVLVSPGDHVEEDEVIFVVETDKASMEIPSPFEGTVEEISVEPGQLVRVGDVLIVFSGEGKPSKTKEKQKEPQAEEKAPEEKVEQKEETQAEAEQAEKAKKESRREGPVPASPATRRLARELGVELAEVPASGPAGRVTREDVQAYAQQEEQPEREERVSPEREPEEAAPFSPAGAEIPELPDFTRWGDLERVPLRSVRRSTAKQMATAWAQIPHVTHHDEADVTVLEDMRQEYKDMIAEKGGNLTLLIFVLKAVASVLRRFPRFNASLDARNQEIILKKYYHIGTAVDTEQGLIVPVIRDVDQKSITELAVEMSEMVSRIRNGEASLEELHGGSFTITNVGILGGTDFNPIINYPEAAILGMARAEWRPVVERHEGEVRFRARYKLPLILGFDHRINDGADAARFMNELIEMLEDPDKLLLQL
jgi:pyruvate dehydrogenase E2 component (dihydrolipoamide acetyltransferase)